MDRAPDFFPPPPAAEHLTRSTCCYCGTGCGVVISERAGQIVGVAGDPLHPANFGRLCSKGASLHLSTGLTTRALYPELRLQRDVPRQRVAWQAALDHAAERFAAIIKEHGPDSVAFYVSGQLLTEDYYVFNKLARALVGTHNIDSNSRLCMSSAASAYTRTLGADAPPCNYEDFDHADVVLISGANPAWAHPVLFGRLLAAREKNPQQKWIVVDPRRSETAAAADLHLAIEPGTDTILLGAMLHVLLWEGLTDGAFIAAHTNDFALAREAVRELTPAAAAAICGIKAEDIVQAARWFGSAPAALSLWCQGLNQSTHGSDNGAALIHLHLATGQIGRPGAGPFSLTGQPNAMGGRESGSMATLLPGHRDPGNPQHRAEVAAYWGIPALSSNSGATATQIIDGLAAGRIKAVWIACTNPAQSLPDQGAVRAALRRAEFVVVQEAFADTETCLYADLLLPAASWGEKNGTVTNSERRISRVRAAIAPPGEARPDWRIACDFALALSQQLGRADAAPHFNFTDPAAIFAEHAGLTAGRDLDYSTLTYALLESDGPQQWPYRNGASTARLYHDQLFPTADGKARFVPIRLAGPAEATTARYPLHLNTGRLRDQWHGMSRTGTVPKLHRQTSECQLLLAAGDMGRRELKDGDLVRVNSRRGEIIVPVFADPAQKPGHAWLPMHWGRRRLSHAAANELIAADIDPYSKQPELKHAAIRIGPAELPWRGEVAVHLADSAAANALSAKLAGHLRHFDYAAISLAGEEDAVLQLHLAHRATPASEVLRELLATLDFEHEALRYEDLQRGIAKRARITDQRLVAFAFFGETAAAPWITNALRDAMPTSEFRRWLFAPLPQAPIAQTARDRIVCHCMNVSESALHAAIAAGCNSYEALQAKLDCGKGCGGCAGEIRKLLAAAR